MAMRREVINKYTIPFVMGIVWLVCFSETMIVIAQSNSTNPDRRNIIVTWSEANDTKSIDNTPVISVSREDFNKIFEQLLRESVDGTTSSYRW